MAKRSYPLSEVYRLLEPGPVVMVSTLYRGRPNVMTMSWQTMIDFEPPLVGLIISNLSHTFGALKSTRECAINIPTVKIARQAVGCGNASGRKVDKFERFGLTALPASRIKAPLVGECYANLECRVVDSSLANKYNLFIAKVLKAWIDPAVKNPRTPHHNGKGIFTLDGRRIRVPSRMP
jgi:flavin reductase (DIM6/NTAB) family NADH-FMN oxidoreductase RutF